ncbi:MAG: molybdenum cofactor guanylyltransferase [Bacteroidales bacterium]|nr:molybdenum cofactor guanylyltransferase [Bacteroidales bacterium]
MIPKPSFIIIGSTGRNTGKTEFACRLIKTWSVQQEVYGLKVTTINKKEGKCPRGGEGCGVCSSLVGDFEIIEETGLDGEKDTSRMLVSGAKKVYWLKVSSTALDKGIDALLKLIPDDVAVVCESNGVRNVLEPSIFLVIKNLKDKTIKPNCARVIRYASKIIEFDNMSWNFPPERVILKNNAWMVREKATAIVLAGGKSSRMGEDKSLLPVNGKPLIAHIVDQLRDRFDEIIIGANEPEKYAFLNLRVVTDVEKDKGPLMGIYSCLQASNNAVNFITACDIPVMNTKLISDMIQLADDVDMVLPVGEENHYEPLFAVYNKSVIPSAETVLNNNCRRIIGLLNFAKVRFINFENSNWYENLNQKADYLNFIKVVETRDCYREIDKS